MQDEVLAVVEASPLRRALGVAMLVAIGVIVVYVAMATPPALGWQLFLMVVGAGALWLSYRVWNATADSIELTRTSLRTGSGQMIAEVAEIEAVDRGVFAFKPSNGFLIRTRGRTGNAWAPGLWWRLGRRVGVGGMTAAGQTKFMSEMLSALLAERQ